MQQRTFQWNPFEFFVMNKCNVSTQMFDASPFFLPLLSSYCVCSLSSLCHYADSQALNHSVWLEIVLFTSVCFEKCMLKNTY